MSINDAPGYDPVLSTAETAKYSGFSEVHWRRLVSAGRTPPPVRLSERKLGWRLSSLNAWIKAREVEQSQTSSAA